MNTFEEELDKILAPFDDIAYRPNFKDFEDAKTAIKAATLRHQVQQLRGMWITAHDVFRDKSTETVGIQEAIDAISWAYEITSGERMGDWFGQDMKDNLGETK
jgi:hypothetical protein